MRTSYEIVGHTLVEYESRRFTRRESLRVDLDRAHYIDWHTPLSSGRDSLIELWNTDGKSVGGPHTPMLCVVNLRPKALRGTPAHQQLISYFASRGGWTSSVDLDALEPKLWAENPAGRNHDA